VCHVNGHSPSPEQVGSKLQASDIQILPSTTFAQTRISPRYLYMQIVR
jgi:hypothetical protein